MAICSDCGHKHGRRRVTESTWHMGACDWCGEHKAVTEDRDYSYPRPPEGR